MAIAGGYRPHTLRVDLGTGSIERQPLPDEEVLRRYVGSTGLGLYLLLRDAPPRAAATDPDAPLIFMVGPLTGTPAVNSSDWTTICYNLLIPYSAGGESGLPVDRRRSRGVKGREPPVGPRHT